MSLHFPRTISSRSTSVSDHSFLFPSQKVHMTNTRITDPEILERRYPVLLHQFSIRKGSGGKGEFNGGDGVIRELEFTEPLQVSILSEVSLNHPFPLFHLDFILVSSRTKRIEADLRLVSSFASFDFFQRRVHAPFGLHGGQPASCGLNLWIKAPTKDNPTPRTVNIGGKATTKMGGELSGSCFSFFALLSFVLFFALGTDLLIFFSVSAR